MPASLCTAFKEQREYAQLLSAYHDGTIQRSQLAQTSRRTFTLGEAARFSGPGHALCLLDHTARRRDRVLFL